MAELLADDHDRRNRLVAHVVNPLVRVAAIPQSTIGRTSPIGQSVRIQTSSGQLNCDFGMPRL